MRFWFTSTLIVIVTIFHKCSSHRVDLLEKTRELKQSVNSEIEKYEKLQNEYLVDELCKVQSKITNIEKTLLKHPNIQHGRLMPYNTYQMAISATAHEIDRAIEKYAENAPKYVDKQLVLDLYHEMIKRYKDVIKCFEDQNKSTVKLKAGLKFTQHTLEQWEFDSRKITEDRFNELKDFMKQEQKHLEDKIKL